MNSDVIELFDTGEIDGIEIPEYGWSAVLNWNSPVKCRPFNRPRLSQIYGFITVSLRYLFYVYRPKKKEGKKPFIDCLNPIGYQPIYGVPMGGIGSGAINRGFCGEFCRYSLIPGIYEYCTVSVNQFIVTVRKRGITVYQQVLSVYKAPEDTPSVSCWNWQFPRTSAAYIGLFPRAWTVYDISEQKVKLYCRQISPVIPHDYQDSCLPLCVFDWTAINYGKEDVSISICCILQNGTGIIKNAPKGLRTSHLKNETFDGCCMRQKIRDMDCCFGLAAVRNQSVSVTSCASISLRDTKSNNDLPNPSDLWTNLMNFGDLSKINNQEAESFTDLAMATCARVDVKAFSKSVNMQFSFVWHMPKVHFRDGGVQYKRRYARWFDYENLERGVMQMISHSFKNVQAWEEKIVAWQKPILNNKSYPDWYKSALFNELYFIVDGGTVWLDKISPDTIPNDADSCVRTRLEHQNEYGLFGYLEGHEYRMYNTYDVHYYSSWALVSLWPKLQESIQYDIADATKFHDSSTQFYIYKGKFELRSSLYAIPHDAGDPEEEPFLKYNAYIMYNTANWKDLSPKFVLQVFRDWLLTQNEDYLKYMMPITTEVMKRCLVWDKDGDGVIENSGFADQTYDAWVVTGISAYTGGLWLSALYALCYMSQHLNIDCTFFCELLKKGKKAYEAKLWTGSFFKYDECNSSVMAAQLSGHWYLKSCGIPDNEVFDQAKIKIALQTIFQNNCVSFGQKFGAINGCFPGGVKDRTSVQSEEFWLGVNYSLAATMLLENCSYEAWTLAEGAYRTVYETYGLQFQSPEAYFDDGRFRSLGYMRPLAIWAMQQALDLSSSDSKTVRQPLTGL